MAHRHGLRGRQRAACRHARCAASVCERVRGNAVSGLAARPRQARLQRPKRRASCARFAKHRRPLREANAGLMHATFPAVRAALQRIAEDEARHAALAWRFVAWGVARAPELAERLRQRFALEVQRAEHARQSLVGCAPTSTPHTQGLVAGGIVDDASRAELRLQALRELVAPCLAALDSAPRTCASARSSLS